MTWPGRMMRGRHSLAILRLMGIADTVAGSADEYVEIAVRLARIPPGMPACGSAPARPARSWARTGAGWRAWKPIWCKPPMVAPGQAGGLPSADEFRLVLPVAVAEERHYGRPMRCFADRPRSLHALFAAAVGRAPSRMAVVGERGRATWAELDDAVGRVAGNLARRGVIRGSRVAMLLGNGRPFLWTLWACARLGAIAVPLGARLKAWRSPTRSTIPARRC